MMPTLRIFVISALCCLVWGVPAKAENDFKRIYKFDEFQQKVVGRRLVYQHGGTVVFLENGRLSGSFSGSLVNGIWEWREDRVCHQLSIGTKMYKADCRAPMIDGKKIKFIQEDGHYYGVARIK